MRNIVLMMAMATLILTGCGRKEAPQVMADAPPPAITQLAHTISGNSLQLSLRLSGGEGGVGYQIDRAEIDPACDCPSFWRRYFEEYPNARLRDKELSKMINLRSSETAYAFRVRAVDALGRLGPWSKPIRARAEAFYE